MSKIEKTIRNLSHGALIRVEREGLEGGWADGYLVGTGPEFFAIHMVDQGIRLDGFKCLRYADVSSIDAPAPFAALIDRVLELRGQEVVGASPVDLSSVATLIRTAGEAFAVVTLFLESQDPDVCFIGKVLSVDDERVQIRCIDPGGVWEDGEESYALSEVTRVDFGDSYAEALVLVGGEG